jgi:hypothetical protein
MSFWRAGGFSFVSLAEERVGDVDTMSFWRAGGMKKPPLASFSVLWQNSGSPAVHMRPGPCRRYKFTACYLTA